jgi:hypothetical protein
MRCQACGTEVVAEAIYCHKCGERLGEHPSTAADVGAAAAAAIAGGTVADRLRQTVSNNTQRADEADKELWQGGYSSKAMVKAWAISGAATIGLLVLWIWLLRSQQLVWWLVLLGILAALWLYQLAVLAYRRISVRYLLTTQRFVFERGVLRRTTDCIEVVDISDVTFEQSILDRLSGVGTIRIMSSDRSAPVVVMPGIENVAEVSRTIDEVRRNERRRRGLHIEQI